MRTTKVFILLLAVLSFTALACGKDRDKPPSNRDGYIDGREGETDQPAKDHPDEDRPTPDEKHVGPGYIVQVDVVNSKAAADQLASELRAARISNAIERLDKGNYRVFVGKNLTKARAERMLNKIVDAGFSNAKIIEPDREE